MEREELESKINEQLGSTQLGLSSQTLDTFYAEALADITDDAQVTDEYVTRKVNYLKTLDGQIHADVSKEIKSYKERIMKKDKGNEGKDAEGAHTKDGGGKGDDIIAEMRKELAELKTELAAEKKSAEKTKTLDNVMGRLKDKMTKAGMEVNQYFLKQAKRDLVIPDNADGESPDVDALVKQAERLYTKHVKDAGFETAHPSMSRRAGKAGDSAVEAFFKRKKQKEGWGNKS